MVHLSESSQTLRESGSRESVRRPLWRIRSASAPSSPASGRAARPTPPRGPRTARHDREMFGRGCDEGTWAESISSPSACPSFTGGNTPPSDTSVAAAGGVEFLADVRAIEPTTRPRAAFGSPWRGRRAQRRRAPAGRSRSAGGIRSLGKLERIRTTGTRPDLLPVNWLCGGPDVRQPGVSFGWWVTGPGGRSWVGHPSGRGGLMPTVAMVSPIPADKVDAWLPDVHEIAGPRREEVDAAPFRALRRQGSS